MITTTQAPDAWADDPQVCQAVADYLADLEAGRRPDKTAFLARHPAIAGPLGECLAALEFVQTVAPATGPAPVLGDYRIVREVGRGGMGVVYEAEQISLGRRVALKVLPAAAALDPRQLQRFRTEAQAAAQLRHPHVVPVHAVGCEGGIHFLVMEFIDGETLAARIDRERTDPSTATGARDATPWPSGPAEDRYRTAARVGVMAAGALAHAHAAGVIHRDVKPGNLLVEPSGHVWVADFGLARLSDGGDLTRTGELVGTLRYMSPEQARGGVALDPRTDVYSLGVTLYELLTRRPAFPGEDRPDVLRRVAADEPAAPRKVDAAIPADLETVVLKAMAKDRAERYATATEFGDDLQRFLDDRPVVARPVGQVRRLVKWVRRNPRPAGLVAAIFVVLVAGLTATSWKWREADGQRRRAEDLTDTLAQRARDLAAATDLVERGRAHARADRWAVADEAYIRALELIPDHPLARSERAELYCHVGLWDRALVEARAARPPARLEDDAALWYRLGILAERTGNATAYRQACLEATHPDHLAGAGALARWTAGRLCVLAPGGHPDPDRVLADLRTADGELGRMPAPTGTDGPRPAGSLRARVLATAFLRAGRYADVIRLLPDDRQSDAQATHAPTRCLLLALAHSYTDHATDARLWFDRAERWLDGIVFPQDWARPAPPRPFDTWADWAEFGALYDEALARGLSARSTAARDHTVRCRALLAVGDRAGADAELARATAAAPDDPRPLLSVVRDYLAADRPNRAAAVLARAADLRPGDSKIWEELFQARLKAGDRSGAATALARWTALRPSDPEVGRTAFRALADAGDWPAARAELARAVALAPTDDRLRLAGFSYLADRDRWPDAYAERDRVLAVDPRNAVLSMRVGVYFWDRNDHTRARPEFFRTVLIRPFEKSAENFWGWYNLGAGAYRQQDWRLARVCYKFATWYDPNHAEIHASLARAELYLGNWAGAAAGFGRAVELAPTGPDAHENRRAAAYCYVVAGMIPAYRRTCADFLAQYPGPAAPDPRTAELLLWACTLHPEGWVDGPRLLRICEQIKDAFPPREAASLHAKCLYRAGRLEAAQEAIPVLRHEDRDSAYNFQYLALIHARLGDRDAAARVLHQGPDAASHLRLRPGNWQAHVYYAVLRREAEAALGQPLSPVRLGP